MALSFTRLSWLWLGGKEKELESNDSLVNSISSLGDEGGGVGSHEEADSLKFNSLKGVTRQMPPSTSRKKAKTKWKSREERIMSMHNEHDVVLVPSDGIHLSGSDTDDSDWSIGWLEPHAPDFQSDDEGDNSFAVLVPCYRRNCNDVNEDKQPGVPFLNSLKNLPIHHSADRTKYMEQWLSYLQKF